MARHKRSPGQMALVEAIETWYMPAASLRGRLRKIIQYTDFIDRAEDMAAARLIAEEARGSLEQVQEFVVRWQVFWSMLYDTERMSDEEIMAALRRLREQVEQVEQE